MDGAVVSAVNALNVARMAGIEIQLDGDDLMLEASAQPASDVLALLSRHKVAIVAFLRPGTDGWSAEDWWALFDERAGIAEFDGGLPQDQAEAHASGHCLAEWLRNDPMRAPPHQGSGYGEDNQRQGEQLPFGPKTLDPECQHFGFRSECHGTRKSETLANLGSMGIEQPVWF